ncbi:MAG: hypothetical protein IJH92_08415 [Mogibacterium sp.]|nr:hypothetical protein [Mogibacterium sp.]
MDIFREQIEKSVYEQKKLLEDYTLEYSRSFEADYDAHLICCRNKGKDTYYRAEKENGRYIRKSLSRDQDAINALARKEYLRITIDDLKHNIKVLERSCGELKDLDFDTIRAQMQRAYAGLPEECFFSNTYGRVGKISENNNDKLLRHREWGKAPYEKSTFMPEGRRFMTSAGFRVRSKSEQHIVEQLVNYGVPFRYEQIIHAEDLDYSADFTFRDRNMELFYWEHAGMMDLPRYADRHRRKMSVFESLGIFPWKNLIVTYDIDGTINIPMIKSIIENEVIPRM